MVEEERIIRSLDCFHNNKVRLNSVVIIADNLANDSVPIHGSVLGDYNYSYRAPQSHRDSFGFGLSGIGIGSSDEFGHSLGRSLVSGIAGHTAGRLAQTAGLGDFASSVIGSLASAYVSADGASPEGLTSLGHISESHGDRSLEIEVIGFNPEQFHNEIAQIKQTIFEDAIADGASPEETIERIEVLGEWAEETIIKAKKEGKSDDEAVEEVRKNVEIAREIVKIDQEVRKESTGHSVLTTGTNSNINPDVIELIYSRLTQNNIFETPYEKAMRTYLFIKLLEVSAQPTPENLSTLSKAINVAKRKAVRVLDRVYEWITPQTAEAMPVVVGTAVDVALIRAAIWLSENPQLVKNAMSTVSGLWHLGQIFERSKAKSSSSSAPARGSMKSGGGSAMPPDPEKEPRNERKERIVDTAEGRNECWNQMKKSGEWESVSGYDKSTLRNKDTGDLAQKSIEKWEIEVYNKREAHIGVIKPSDGRFHPELKVPGRMMRK